MPRASKLVWLPVAAMLAGGGCDKDRVGVTKSGEEKDGDYGRAEMLAAVERYTSGERTAARYRELAVEIDRLRPGFHEAIAAEAERHLVVLALGPLSAHTGESPGERFDALALTVWPTALEVSPREGESAEAYGERLCGGELALDCKYWVESCRPLVLSGEVWKRLRDRAREAARECDNCDGELDGVVEAYEEQADAIGAEIAEARHRCHPNDWPVAGAGAQTWSHAPILARDPDGPVTVGGESVPPGEWLGALEQARADGDLLGVHLTPKDRVASLRAIARTAGRAGYSAIALQVRSPEYPWPLREYRMTLTNGGKRLPVRDVDTIQVLVQALDATETPFRL